MLYSDGFTGTAVIVGIEDGTIDVLGAPVGAPVGDGVGSCDPEDKQYPHRNPSRTFGLNVQTSSQEVVSCRPLCIAEPRPKTQGVPEQSPRVGELVGDAVGAGDGGMTTSSHSPQVRPFLNVPK